MKYRIKSKQHFAVFNLFNINGESSEYVVQNKIPYIPMWFTITRTFQKLAQAEEYIELILDEKGE